MIKMKLSSVKPGMFLAKSIYTDDGTLLIDSSVALLQTYINKLSGLGYTDVYVAWGKEIENELTDIYLEDTKNETVVHAQALLGNTNLPQEESFDQLKMLVIDLIHDLLANRQTRVHLTDIRAIDEYSFGHSVNVCVFSLMMGILLDLNPEALVDLGIGALLHDIGKLTIPLDVLNKPADLDQEEYEVIKQHPLKGYGIVSQIQGISELARMVVRDHHERFNGKGYPNELKGENIHLFSRIVAICDVYDALTSDRIYKQKVPAHYAVEYLLSMGGHQFDYDLVRTFLKNIRIYTVGTPVKLTTGETCVVVQENAGWPTRPVIEVHLDASGESVAATRKIDLMKHLNYNILAAM